MYRTISYVEDEQLYQHGLKSDHPIIVGTSAWFEWLEQHSAFTFVDHFSGYFEAHKRGTAPTESEWEASRIRAGQNYSVRLGSTSALTLERLRAAARTLASQYLLVQPLEELPVDLASSEYPTPMPAAPFSPTGTLTQIKIAPPHVPSDVISRPRLLARLNAGLDGPLTLLCAPAGFGKTTLLAQWLTTLARPLGWLSLDAADNELPLFVHRLAATFAYAVPGTYSTSAGLLAAPQFPSLQEVIKLLISELADMPENVLLVLDNYHFIENDQIHTLITQLVEYLPPQLHLVLSSRSEPPLPLARWRARGQLNEMGAADLRLTPEETYIFLARLLGNKMAHETAKVLEEQTGGWAALLRLAAQSLRDSPDLTTFLQRLAQGPDRTMRDYLLEEVLAWFAPLTQEVFIRLSLLEQFNARLGSATLGNEVTAEQVQEMFDTWEQAGLLMVPLDEQPGWYRLHPLLRIVFQQRLRAHPEELIRLHRRASRWYAEQGLVEEAL
ncbi:MAG TPA: hypothetical protein VH593_28530, partial [Ktedonobacteraceae bacterium]